jgi:uncharacterized LabA/DUF88 family protein
LILKDQRVAIFVDVQNVFYTAKSLYKAKLDFDKLLKMLVMDRKLIRAVAYVVQMRESDQLEFMSFLNRIGFEVKTKKLKVRHDGTAKGDWDMGLAIDAISVAEKVDVVIIISSDGDFTALVNHLKAHGVKVEVCSFPSNTPDELKDAATEYRPLTEEYLMPSRK